MVTDGSAPDDGTAELAATYAADVDAQSARVPDEPRRPTRLWVVLSRWLDATEAWLRSHGDKRLRRGIRIFWVVIALSGVGLLVGPVINPPLSLEDITSSAQSATDHWIARDFDAHYTIARDSHGQLIAHVTENITAFFPDGVDESGIQRVIATDYEGHALDPTNVSATLDGSSAKADQRSSPTRLTISMDAGERLSGDHSFVLSYELHNLAYSTTDAATGKPIDLLRWDVFGPSWPQAFASLAVSVTIPKDLDDRLVRAPRGELAWLIIGAGEWLTPDASAPGEVTYEFSSDQNVPPHANADFVMSFDTGTFTMPPHGVLWWIQTFGPVAPLVLLLISLLFSLAARAVAWGDAHGRAWYVAQFDPPPHISPAMAAQVIRSPEAVQLADTLTAAITAPKRSRREALLATARSARRAGRLGDRPRALVRYLFAAERATVVTFGLRRVPRGFVRDLFIGGAIALTLVQWGLVRQLSHQVQLSIVWWPVVFVLASSVLAIIVLTITLTARPLTEKGAAARQYLLGVREYVVRTNFLQRASLTEALLPYAVLVVPARTAGARVVALVRNQLPDEDPTRGWRASGFLTRPRLLLRIAAPLAVIATIVIVATVPMRSGTPDYLSYSGDLPGTHSWHVDSAALSAALSRTSTGHAKLAVTEELTVDFDEDSAHVPQFIREWPGQSNGQSLGLSVATVMIDGSRVPFVIKHEADSTAVVTQLEQPLTGTHSVEVSYSLASAAVAARSGSGTVDRVRWAALLDGWSSSAGWGDPDHPTAPLTISLSVPDDLAHLATASGWLGLSDPVPFGDQASSLFEDGPSTETSTDDNGVTTRTLTPIIDADGQYPLDLAVSDVGSQLDFPAGTFSGPDAGALRFSELAPLFPSFASIAIGTIALAIGAFGIVSGVRRRPRVFLPGFSRDLVRQLGPALSLASVILFGWASMYLSGDEPQFAPLISTSMLSLVASIAALVLTRTSRGSS